MDQNNQQQTQPVGTPGTDALVQTPVTPPAGLPETPSPVLPSPEPVSTPPVAPPTTEMPTEPQAPVEGPAEASNPATPQPGVQQ